MTTNVPADPPPSEPQGARFRRTELEWQLTRLAHLVRIGAVPLHVGAYAPVIEFHVQGTDQVHQVAAAIGRFPTQFKDEYFVDLDSAELRVRWTSALPAADPWTKDPTGMDYTRADDEGLVWDRNEDDPTPVSPARAEPHTGAVLSGIAEDGHKLGAPGKPIDQTGGYWQPSTPPVPVAAPHPSWPIEAELKPWESLAPTADRVAESATLTRCGCGPEHGPQCTQGL